MHSSSSPPPSPTSTSPKRVRFNPIVHEIEPEHFIIVSNPFDDEASSSEDEDYFPSTTSHYESITSTSNHFSHFDDDTILPSLVYSHDAPSAANLQHSIQNAYDELMDITAELFPSARNERSRGNGNGNAGGRSGGRGKQGLGERCNVFPSEIWRKPAWRDGAVTARGVRCDEGEDLD